MSRHPSEVYVEEILERILDRGVALDPGSRLLAMSNLGRFSVKVTKGDARNGGREAAAEHRTRRAA